MKKFTRWWIRKYNHRKGNDNSHLGYPEAHQAWRAALERVLEQEYDYHGPTAYDWIREELKE